MAPAATVVSKLKVHLKLSISRLRIVQQKDDALAKQQRRAMAQLIEQGKYESARIRVENIIRSDLTTELYEILELYCELLLARAGLLEGSTMDPGLEEAIVSIVYATPRVEVKELTTVRALLFEKYGREWATRATDDVDGNVPERVKRKLRVEPPGHELVESYLKAIATTYDIKYGEELAQDSDDDDGGGTGGGQGEAVLATKEPQESDKEPPLSTNALQDMSTPPPKEPGTKSPVSIVPPSPSTDNTNPKIKFPGPPDLKPGPKMAKAQQPDKQDADAGKAPGRNVNGSKPAGKVPDIDDLEARFARLKR